MSATPEWAVTPTIINRAKNRPVQFLTVREILAVHEALGAITDPPYHDPLERLWDAYVSVKDELELFRMEIVEERILGGLEMLRKSAGSA